MTVELKDTGAITLMGMSGVGKTWFSALLEREGWTRISCDFEIANTHLKDHLDGSIDSAENIDALSGFVGLVGDPAKGGLKLETFTHRQKLYYDAECATLHKAVERVQVERPIVIDSTGSLCEINDDALIDALGRNSLFVYLQASEAESQAVIERAQTAPKPLFYPPATFPLWLDEYMHAQDLHNAGQIDPKDFARWVFPKLFASRLPKYERLADQYGVTIPSAALKSITTSEDFLALLDAALKEKHTA